MYGPFDEPAPRPASLQLRRSDLRAYYTKVTSSVIRQSLAPLRSNAVQGLMRRKKFADALALLDVEVEQYIREGKKRKAGLVLHDIAACCAFLGRWDRVTPAVERSYRLLVKANSKAKYASWQRICVLTAYSSTLYLLADEYEKEEEALLERAMKKALQRGHTTEAACAGMLLALLYERTLRGEEAFTLWKDVRAMTKRARAAPNGYLFAKNIVIAATAEDGLAVYHERAGRLADAVRCSQAALKRWRNLGELAGSAKSSHRIANICYMQGKFRACVASSQLAISFYRDAYYAADVPSAVAPPVPATVQAQVGRLLLLQGLSRYHLTGHDEKAINLLEVALMQFDGLSKPDSHLVREAMYYIELAKREVERTKGAMVVEVPTFRALKNESGWTLDAEMARRRLMDMADLLSFFE